MVDGPVAAPRRPLDTTTIANQRGLMIQPSTSRSQPWSSSRQILQLGGDRRGGQPVAGPVQQAGQLLDAEAAVGEQEGEQQVRVGGAGGRRRVGFVLDDDQLVEGQAEHARQAGEQRQGDGPLVEVDLQVIQVNADGRVARGISAPGSRRSVHNSLPLHGSCRPGHLVAGFTQAQCAKYRGRRAAASVSALAAFFQVRHFLYLFMIHRSR
jgi:hypothetical protein